ncbi:MAG: hypothetical protein WEB53_15830 [Akkermansiaceae bacterium]
MNAFFYIKVFAWIAIVALACSVFSDFWIPMVCGAIAITLLGSLAASSRR